VAQSDPAALAEEIRRPVLDTAAAVALRDVTLALGPATLHVERGLAFPARLGGGRPLEWVLIGQATFRLEPPDEIEAAQIELFTGERTLDVPVEEAVLVPFADGTLAEFTAGVAPRGLRAEQVQRAAGIHREWLDGPVRRGVGVEAALLGALVGDPLLAGYAALWCRSFEAGEFLYQLDPEDAEQVTVASFRGLTLGAWERARLRHQIRVEQRKGRFLDTRVEDLGAWDVWLSTPLAGPGGAPRPAPAALEAEHYEIDVTFSGRSLALDGRVRMRLRAGADGRRVARLDLVRDLRVSRVTDEQGRELFFTRCGAETLVVLPEPTRAGAALTLDVRWGGRALTWIEGRYHDLDDTRAWHPHCGAADRATYDVTLRFPARHQVLAAGTLVQAGRDGSRRFERRKLERPGVAFTFALGRFDVERTRAGHVDLTVAFHHAPNSRTDADQRRRTLSTVARALAFFEERFGPYPADELTVVTVPRGYSQSFSGFVTLGRRLVTPDEPLSEAGEWFHNMTVAHEIAHQWWGNLVGWRSYRDQWLSEGLANYAALLFDAHLAGEPEGRLAALSAGWRRALAQVTPSGRTIESFGPVVLGSRLNSSLAGDVYRPIVYRKGAVILAMLARAVGQERFLETLRWIAGGGAGPVLTTGSFLDAVAGRGSVDLAGFARQYVYGTGIPEVYYGFESRPAGGGWTVEGRARFLESPRWRFVIARDAAGRPELRRLAPEFTGATPAAGPAPALVVPYVVASDGSREWQDGQLVLDARGAGFEIRTPFEPADLRLDPRGETLAWFYSVRDERKRVLRYRAEDLLAEGRLDEAAAAYHEVLATPAVPGGPLDPLGPAPTTPRTDVEVEDLRARLGLVRVELAQGRAAGAERRLAALDAELASRDEALLRVERDVLRARIELETDQAPSALKRLRRTLRLTSPREPVLWPALAARARLGAERAAVTEGWALCAVAAARAGRPRELAAALREARARGVDVGELDGR